MSIGSLDSNRSRTDSQANSCECMWRNIIKLSRTCFKSGSDDLDWIFELDACVGPNGRTKE